MGEQKHTPGEWRTDPECEHECVIGEDGMLIADCAIFGGEHPRHQDANIANARLIAAAPELFQFVERISRFTPAGADPEDDAAVINGLIAVAKSLFAKVQGTPA